jgi:glycerophosphoryl diester phosphodiesterase
VKALILFATLVMAGAVTACASTQQSQKAQPMWSTLDGNPPLIIAHRGASGYLPEHTLEGYALAIDQGADVVEPDLVFTKDGVLVARHDRYISTTTDIADHPEFAGRKRNDAYFEKSEGETREDWWIEDFTLAELKTLRARQPREGRSKEFDGLYEIPTFDEILALAARKSKEAGRPVGVYPETKHPGFFESIGHDFEAPLLAALEGFDAGPVYIQSFEAPILKRLKGKTDAKLVQLVLEETPGAGPNIAYEEIAEYADGVGPAKDMVVPGAGRHSVFLEDAHKRGLFVHPWTFRNDQPNDKVGVVSAVIVKVPSGNIEDLPGALEAADLGNLYTKRVNTKIEAEYSVFFAKGVDGVFTDFPDTAVRVRDEMGPPIKSTGKD